MFPPTPASLAVSHSPPLSGDMKTLTNRETVKIFPHMQARRILSSVKEQRSATPGHMQRREEQQRRAEGYAASIKKTRGGNVETYAKHTRS